MTEATMEKDVDLSTDRDISRGVDRTSYTGSDDKSKSYDTKVDVGEAEAVASGLANSTNLKQAFEAALLQQVLRQNEAALRQQEELSVIKQRQLSNSADFDQTIRELTVTHTRDRHSQDVTHRDGAFDRFWNVDEQGYQVAKILEALGIDNRVAFSAVLTALASVIGAGGAKQG